MPRTITARDMFRVRLPSDPRVAPDGAAVAYTEGRLLRGADTSTSRVVVVDGRDGRILWHSPAGVAARAPRWSPDGARLCLVMGSGRAESLAIVARGSWAMRDLAAAARRIADPAWSPDGTRIAFSAEEPPGRADGGVASWYVDDVRYKVDGRPVRGSRAARNLRIVDVTSGECTRLTTGEWRDAAPAWSPASDALAFVSDRDRPSPASDVAGLYVVAVAEPGSPRRIVDPVGTVSAPAWAPDGTSIAFIGHARGDAQGVDQEIRIVDAGGGPARSLSGALGRSVGLVPRSDDVRGMGDARLEWAGGGSVLWFRYADGGSGRLARVDMGGRIEIVASGDRSCLDFSVVPDGSLAVFVSSTPDIPGDLRRLDVVEGTERRLADPNRWLRGVALASTSLVRAQSPDGQPVEGWLIEPLGAAARPWPVVLSVHGGPHYPTGWRWWFEGQRLAARGYAVLTGNPRGSQGYGEAYATANRGDWGGGDFQDVLALLDAALRRPSLDPRRVAITGVSYGGYMTLWAISRTDRFRAAICENGVSDLLSLYGTAEDAGMLWDHEFGRAPWPDGSTYLERSPLMRVEDIHTPLLLIHAELDQGCPVQQSEEMFVALRRLERPVAFLRIPGEGHLVNLVGRPSHRLERADAVDRWLDEHLAQPG